jgi:uncharacterized protein (TIGR02145 family)
MQRKLTYSLLIFMMAVLVISCGRSSSPTPETYVIKLSASPDSGGAINGAGKFKPGSLVTISATAKYGYKFADWQDITGMVLSTDSNYTFHLYHNQLITAVFLRTILIDYDGNVYHRIKIGNQVWTQENLKVTHFRNGDPITDLDSISLTPDYISSYGRLYSGFDVTDSRHLAPAGWHVATDEDWNILANFVGGNSGKLKETGTSHWNDPNVGATNETGFTARPGGLDLSGAPAPAAVGSAGFWWTTTPARDTELWRRAMVNGNTAIVRIKNAKPLYFSVRLVKDSK